AGGGRRGLHGETAPERRSRSRSTEGHRDDQSRPQDGSRRFPPGGNRGLVLPAQLSLAVPLPFSGIKHFCPRTREKLCRGRLRNRGKNLKPNQPLISRHGTLSPQSRRASRSASRCKAGDRSSGSNRTSNKQKPSVYRSAARTA